jgi:hypothetical protein
MVLYRQRLVVFRNKTIENSGLAEFLNQTNIGSEGLVWAGLLD